MILPQLETRKCPARGCTRSFKVPASSVQATCSKFCWDQVMRERHGRNFTQKQREFMRKLGLHGRDYIENLPKEVDLEPRVAGNARLNLGNET